MGETAAPNAFPVAPAHSSADRGHLSILVEQITDVRAGLSRCTRRPGRTSARATGVVPWSPRSISGTAALNRQARPLPRLDDASLERPRRPGVR